MFSVPVSHSGRKQPESSSLQIRTVPLISSEKLISSISRQRYRYVLPGQAAHMVGWDHGRVAEGFFQRTRQQMYGLFDVRFNVKFVMVRPEALCNYSGMVAFIEIGIREPDGECLDGPRTEPRHQGYHNR